MQVLRSYQVGFNGHAKCCECVKCSNDRIHAFRVWFAQQSKLPDMPDRTRTVFVRPHWRKQPNHLRKMPVFKKMLMNGFLA